jgi:hypothetical protein
MKENGATTQFSPTQTEWKKIRQLPNSHSNPRQSERESGGRPILTSPQHGVKENPMVAQFSSPPLTKADYKLD